MRYFGGKQRIAKELRPLIARFVDNRKPYVEPFVGGASILCGIAAPLRIASDSNAALITMYKSLAKGWVPPEDITEADYLKVKGLNNPRDPLTAFVGFGCSFAGKWFGGYARGGLNRNYAANAASSLRKKMRGLKGVKWRNKDYQDVDYPDNSVIYCDPPYQGTTQYGAVDRFNWEVFWDFCRVKSYEGQIVLISEYEAPSDFISILDIETNLDIRDKTGIKPSRTEKLFQFKENLDAR